MSPFASLLVIRTRPYLERISPHEVVGDFVLTGLQLVDQCWRSSSACALAAISARETTTKNDYSALL